MARPPRPAHPESARKGALAAAIAVLLILCFLPGSILGWLDGPRRLVSMVLTPVSHPIHELAVWVAPAAPRPDNAQVAHLEAERDRFKTLYLQNEQRIAELLQRIKEFEQSASLSEGPIRLLTVPVIANTSAPVGGAIKIKAGTRTNVDRSTIASTSGDQLVGRLTDVGAYESWITLITDKASGQIDGIVLADDGTPGADIRNMAPLRGQRLLQGQVKYPGPKAVVGDVVRLQDSSWPRSAQRLIVGKVVEISELAGGRAVVKVKPSVDLERLGEVVLRIAPQTDATGSGGGR